MKAPMTIVAHLCPAGRAQGQRQKELPKQKRALCGDCESMKPLMVRRGHSGQRTCLAGNWVSMKAKRRLP